MNRKIPLSHPSFYSSSFYVELIDAHTKIRALKSGRSIHAHLIIKGLASSVQLGCKLIAFYTGCKHLEDARKLFDKIPKSNIRGWVAVVGSYSRNAYYQEAMGAFEEMRNEGFKYDRIVIPSVLKACGQLFDYKTGVRLHAVVLKNEFESDAFVMCALIDMYSKCGIVEKAKRVFDVMTERDLVALNAMVSGFVQNGFAKEALHLVEEMKLLGVKPDIVTWNSLISGFSQANDEVMVGELFKIMEIDGVKPDVISWTSVISGSVPISHHYPKVLLHIHSSRVIDMYAKCGSIFEAMNTVTWNSMIFGYANHGYCQEAIELFNQMLREEEQKLDHLTFTAALTACVHGGMVDLGGRLFLLMQEKYGIEPRLEHYACMVNLLGRDGKLDEAYGLIQRMPFEPDVFIWGALLGACRQHDCLVLAEIAAKQLAKLEPRSCGSSMLLLNLYADSSRWGNVIKVKEMMKKRKLRTFPSCSWIEVL
ncbi:hypothetical protein CDL12_01963 [Handroanthus impetiginosus]|uniref:Uncharacterized protein n=1 Tax=Handroanthus impetiginosus TaxID=429701 RepID=A0A2G9I6A3_9LAMI|nr:hypothetical protein CDL12_01963 [Handroanthus impetiginosus]